MYVSAPADPSPPSTSNFIPELPRILALGPQTLHVVPVEALENGHWERVRADLARFLLS